MGVKDGMRAHTAGEPPPSNIRFEEIDLEVSHTLRGSFDYLHLFVLTQADLTRRFPQLRGHLRPRGMLWVSWPRARQLGTDLTLPEVIRIGYDAGLVESTTLSIDTTWSAIKFTHPKPGKIYQNSFGRLPDQ